MSKKQDSETSFNENHSDNISVKSNVQVIPPSNFNLNLNQQEESQQNYPQNNESLLQKISSTANEVLDFIKSKTSSIQSMNPLIKNEIDINNLYEINMNDFEKERNGNCYEVKTNTLEKGNFNDKKLTVVIRNPQQINDSYFRISYVIYEIITEEFNFIVYRRYSDFLWLRECLKALFPTEIIPVLPKKKIGNRRFELDFIHKRIKGLQRFINEILTNEKYKATEPLMDFLSIQERQLFEQKMNVVNNKSLTPSKISLLNTFEGKVNLMDFEIKNSISVQSYYTNISDYIKSVNHYLNKIHDNLHYFQKNMALACNNLDEVEKSFLSLKNFTKKVNISHNLENIYQQYHIFFKNWKRVLINQTCLIKDIIHKNIKNVIGLGETLSEIFSKEEGIRDEYFIKKNKLLIKKDTLWLQKDITKWETNQMENIDMIDIYNNKNYAYQKMCYKETEEINKLKSFMSYYYYNNQDTFKDFLNKIENLFFSNLEEFIEKFHPTLSDSFDIYSHLSSHIRIE